MEKSVEERVQILLELGVQQPRAWLGVKRYEPDGDYAALLEHHAQETEALLAIIAELVRMVKSPPW